MGTKLRLPLAPAWLRWTFVGGVGAFIFYASILTVPPETAVDAARPVPELVPLDKWRHSVASAARGGTLAYATADWDASDRTGALVVVGATVLYGVGIEFGQSLVPYRYFSVGDAYANALGGVLVLPWYAVRRFVELVPVGRWWPSNGNVR